MNNTFNAKRFWLLLKKTVLERPVQTIGFTGLLLALVLIMYTVSKMIGGFGAAQNLTFIWGLTGGSFFLASFMFGYFSSNASGSSFLTLPASHFEKWLCGVLIAGVLYPLIFLLFYRAVDSSFVAMYHHSLDPASPFYKHQYEAVYVFSFTSIIAQRVYQIFFFLTGAMLLGSLYFNKSAFIKVAISICILVIAVVGLNWLMAKLFFGNINSAGPLIDVTIPVGKEEGTIQIPERISDAFNYSIWYIFPAMLWLLAFTRLREKEF